MMSKRMFYKHMRAMRHGDIKQETLAYLWLDYITMPHGEFERIILSASRPFSDHAESLLFEHKKSLIKETLEVL